MKNSALFINFGLGTLLYTMKSLIQTQWDQGVFTEDNQNVNSILSVYKTEYFPFNVQQNIYEYPYFGGWIQITEFR